jgi:tetratricopeptide (TPR) repeat protein
MKLSIVVLSIICPGCGQMALGLRRRGALLLFCCAVFLLAAFLAVHNVQGELGQRLFVTGLCLAAAVWVIAVLDLLLIGRGVRIRINKIVLDQVDQPFQQSDSYKQGRILFLQGKIAEAADKFAEALGKEPGDVDAVYQLARARYELKDKREAARLFRQYVADVKGTKWKLEAQEYLRRL